MSTPFPGINFGDDSSAPIRSYQIEWFDHWLKGAPEEGARVSPETWHQVRSEVDEAPVNIFVMGVNKWRDEQEWPLARTRYTPLYLAGKGHANSLEAATASSPGKWTAKAKPDHFTYDPRNPVRTMRRRRVLRSENFPVGPHGSARHRKTPGRAGLHQRAFEARFGSHRTGSRRAVRVDIGARTPISPPSWWTFSRTAKRAI